jgi:transcriptional regulator with XRE-family HTH domain
VAVADISLTTIGRIVREKRGARGIREVAEEIKISTATLSRIENGKLPDLETFSRLCRWLNVDAGVILGCSQKNASTSQTPIPVTAHFKADKNLSQKTAKALADLIIAAQVTF